MLGFTFVIAFGCRDIVAGLAYRRTTAYRDWETQVDALKQKTADALSKMEKSLRKEDTGSIVEPPQA